MASRRDFLKAIAAVPVVAAIPPVLLTSANEPLVVAEVGETEFGMSLMLRVQTIQSQLVRMGLLAEV